MKVSDYDLSKLPRNGEDTVQQIRTILNLGKYQTPIVNVFPTYRGEAGECVVVFGATTAALAMCTTGGGTTWRIMTLFTL